MIYCLVPRELAARLHDPLRRHFAERRDVEVIVERRGMERRIGGERRGDTDYSAAPRRKERRRVRNLAGRRVGERRASLMPVAAPAELPRRLRRYADRIAFVERVEPSTETLEDMDVARIVTRVQAGDSELFSGLYLRYFDRVYGYMRLLLRDRHEAEDATQEVFTNVFEALPRYERRSQPFRAWLFTVVRHAAVRRLRQRGRMEVVEPSALDAPREANGAESELSALDWISDPDLLLFVERMPVEHRQVLLMRFMLDLSHRQIAEAIGKREDDVRALQYRALQFLRKRLAAVGRSPRQPGRRARMRACADKANVLRARRFALYG